MVIPPLRQCEDCKCWTSNEDHICTVYDSKPCRVCGNPTVFTFDAAPGTGSGWVCKSNHYEPRDGRTEECNWCSNQMGETGDGYLCGACFTYEEGVLAEINASAAEVYVEVL